MRPTALILLAIVALAGCSSPEETESQVGPSVEAYPREETERMRQLMIGTWLGSRPYYGDATVESLNKRYADGTYELTFCIVMRGVVQDRWVEAGIWGVRKPVYFTATRRIVGEGRSINRNDASLYDAYYIDVLNESEFTYSSYASGNQFTVTRVKEGTALAC